MNNKLLIKMLGIVLVIALGLSGCRGEKETPQVVLPTATRTLPPPQVGITRAPDASPVMVAYLEAWCVEDYEAMYALLGSASRATLPLEKFIEIYEDVANQTLLREVKYEILSQPTGSDQAEASYRVTLVSAIVGAIERETVMHLEQEEGSWVVRWDPTLILPELAGGNYLRLDRQGVERAVVYDRKGRPLAYQADVAAIGVWPSNVDLTDDNTIKGLVSLLAGLTGLRVDIVKGMIENAEVGAYLPFGEVLADQDPRRLEFLETWGAAVVSRYSSRYYYGSGVAPHVLGYVSSVQKEEISEYRRKGYVPTEKVGRKGIEEWGETILRGKPGGTLYVFNPEGKVVEELGSAPSQPGQAIYTTLDRDLQLGAQKAMSVFKGAVVVLERDTGRVLAIASTPGFDQNAYQIENVNLPRLIEMINANPDNPQFNRATQGQYPLGSVFKLITIATALQTGRYTADTNYECEYEFTELEGFTRYDWTWEHFQDDGVTQPSGLLTLKEGLIRSCNPYFWHIGLDMHRVGLTDSIANMARNFGLGQATGIVGVAEEAGNVPNPQSEVDAINLAIGQGDLQVTPLQVVDFVAGIGNGGTLYTPQIIEGIASPDSTITSTFEAKTRGALLLTPENLAVIQEAMVGVVRSENPRGTAYRTFQNFDIAVAGKTGTAEAATGKSHAWFAGYTFQNNPEKPDIAIVVLCENAGEGSEFAAPIFRRIVELYFFGKPLRLYRWEANFDVTRSPTLPITETPTPAP